MARTPYQITDEAVAKITTKVSRQFRHNRLALFDELNVVGVKKHINKLYKKSQKIIKNEFLEIINQVYQETYNDAVEQGFDGEPKDLDEDWIDEFLNDYNPTTKYVFNNEIDRKKQYLQENLLSDPDSTDQAYAKAEKYLMRQIKQGGIDLDDAVAKQVYKDLGIKNVQWVAEDDYKTCGVCNELDGEIFDLDKAPDKQHHNCRCYLIPVKE